MLTRLSERLDALGVSALSVLGTQCTDVDGLPSAGHVHAAFGTIQQCQMRAGCAALLHLSHVELLDATGALSTQGREAVAEARWLLAHDLIAPWATGSVAC